MLRETAAEHAKRRPGRDSTRPDLGAFHELPAPAGHAIADYILWHQAGCPPCAAPCQLLPLDLTLQLWASRLLSTFPWHLAAEQHCWTVALTSQSALAACSVSLCEAASCLPATAAGASPDDGAWAKTFAPERDTRATWTTLDVQGAQQFAERYEVKTYVVAQPEATIRSARPSGVHSLRYMALKRWASSARVSGSNRRCQPRCFTIYDVYYVK